MFPRVTHPSATHSEECVRLACVRPAASVRSEPGSNSQIESVPDMVLAHFDGRLPLTSEEAVNSTLETQASQVVLCEACKHASARRRRLRFSFLSSQCQRAGNPDFGSVLPPLQAALSGGPRRGEARCICARLCRVKRPFCDLHSPCTVRCLDRSADKKPGRAPARGGRRPGLASREPI